MKKGKVVYAPRFGGFFRAALGAVSAALCICAAAGCALEPPPAQANLSAASAAVRARRNEGTWYEIFTGSFADSNGDGIGDLRGITLKLDYLNDSGTVRHAEAVAKDGYCKNSLHIDGIWLTPIMPSPSYHKYDTKDYMDIDPQFGTIEDFRELLEKCHERGIKLIIDLVMNHSSQDHPWFQAARQEINEGKPGRYASYYNFWYGATPPEPETRERKWSDTDNKWYYSARYYRHWAQAAPGVWWEGSFWTGMPDLNWDSAALREEFKEVVKFWLNMGLDGFRLDATSWPYDYYGLGQMTTHYDGFNVDEKNIELWTWFSDLCHSVYDNVYLVGECWKDEGTIANYYRSGMNFFAFQFSDMQTPKWAAETGNGETWANTLVYWERTIKARNPRAISAPFLSNHDKGRPTFPNDDVRKMTAALYLLAPGTPFIYYGEEIGMEDHHADDVYEDWDHRGPMWWSNTNQELTPNPPENLDWAVKAPPSGLGVEEQMSPRYFNDSILGTYIRVLTLKNLYPWMAAGYHAESLNWNSILSVMRYVNPDNPDQAIIVVQNTNGNTTVTLPPSVKYVSYAAAVGGAIGIKQPVTNYTGFDIYGYTTYIFQEYE